MLCLVTKIAHCAPLLLVVSSAKVAILCKRMASAIPRVLCAAMVIPRGIPAKLVLLNVIVVPEKALVQPATRR